MSLSSTPRVSIGLPVYNGENFLEPTLDALLAQSFSDFELIISDNASSDGTEAIGRAYAARDRRVRYERLAENIGAAGNWNRVLQIARASYFKWAAHDDLHQPEFLARCVAALDADPTRVLAYSRAITIDASGQAVTGVWGAPPGFGAGSPVARFAEGLRTHRDPLPLPLFGVVRAAALRRTGLMDSRPNCDRLLLAELSLHGRFHELDEPFFLQRDHVQRAGPRLARCPSEAVAFWDPARLGKLDLSHWSLLGRLVRAVVRAPLSLGQRLRCYAELLGWAATQRAGLRDDLLTAAERLPGAGGRIARARRGHAAKQWRRQLQRATRDMEALLPGRATVVFVDDATLGLDQLGGRRLLPFTERDGVYWGPPYDSRHAIRELERMRASGASHLVFAWPAFWWLEHYAELYVYVKARFRCLRQDRRVIIFDLMAAWPRDPR